LAAEAQVKILQAGLCSALVQTAGIQFLEQLLLLEVAVVGVALKLGVMEALAAVEAMKVVQQVRAPQVKVTTAALTVQAVVVVVLVRQAAARTGGMVLLRPFPGLLLLVAAVVRDVHLGQLVALVAAVGQTLTEPQTQVAAVAVGTIQAAQAQVTVALAS
jgi:hypothetical protein